MFFITVLLVLWILKGVAKDIDAYQAGYEAGKRQNPAPPLEVNVYIHGLEPPSSNVAIQSYSGSWVGRCSRNYLK